MKGKFATLIMLAAVVGASGCLFGWTEKAPPRIRRSEVAGDLEVEPGGATGPAVPVKLRVWADQDYRKLPRWKVRARALIERANEYLAASFGIELEPEFKDWERQGDGGDHPDAVLEQLQRHDPGEGADWVLGFTGALPRFSTSQHDLGFAALHGKHMVLRHDDLTAELAYLRQELRDRPKKTRELIIEDRRRHKEVAVLLHEWAHTLGAIHERGGGQLMRQEYDYQAHGFSPMTVRIIRLGLKLRRAETAEEQRVAAEALVSELETMNWPGVEPTERQQILELVRYRLAAAAAITGEPTAAVDESPVPAATAPGSPDRKPPTGAAVARKPPAPPAPPPPPSPAELERQRVVHRQLGIPEDAAARFKITSARQDEYADLFRKAYGALQQGKSAECRRLAQGGLKRFPKAPGLQALICGAEMWDQRLASARRACEAALGAWEETVFAHVFLAQLDEAAGKLAAAVKHLERAMELDPGQAGVWHSLAAHYRRDGRTADLDRLLERYVERFRRQMPEK